MWFVKHNISFQNQNSKPVFSAQSETSTTRNRSETVFSPSPEDVAKRAYRNYVDGGSEQGRDVEHWLEAETQLRAEHNGSMTSGFQSRA